MIYFNNVDIAQRPLQQNQNLSGAEHMWIQTKSGVASWYLTLCVSFQLEVSYQIKCLLIPKNLKSKQKPELFYWNQALEYNNK